MNNILRKSVSFLASKVLNKLRKFKNVHNGETCYIIGGGISLKWFDLDAFSDKLAIPVNYLPLHNDFGKLKVEHTMITEPYFFYPYMLSWWNTIQPIYREKINEYPKVNFITHLSNFPVIRKENVSYLFGSIEPNNTTEMNVFSTVDGSLNQAIKFAIYMGYHQVFLVGFDYTHIPSRNHHWIEKGIGTFVEHPEYNKSFFQAASEFIDIITITLDGKSDFIDSITYEEYTGRRPLFKENTEILDMRALKAFATWPDYKIF